MKNAYVTVLYGNNIYVSAAIVLGHSLKRTKSSFDRVILVTPDVSSEYKTQLKNFYTHIINISYVDVNKNIFIKSDTRFVDVFTKLRCLELIMYDKILLLDLDMIVCKNIDHLFKLTAPAACVKHHNLKYGQKVDPNIICKDEKLIGSINAGLMLLKPNMSEWKNIQYDIMTNEQLHKFKYPEQDYLSLRYCNLWTSITFNYNFQFGLTHRAKKLGYKIDDIYVIHYSSSYKPWNYMIHDYIPQKDEKDFIIKHKKYYDLWNHIYKTLKKKYNLSF